MKGDVGVSSHEKEGEQENGYTQRQKVIQPHPYIFVSFNNLYQNLYVLQSNAQQVKQLLNRNKDVGMGLNDFLSLGGHLLVPLLFHEVASLHPPSFQRNDFSTCSTIRSITHH